MNKLRRLGTTALVGLALLTGLGVAQPAAAETLVVSSTAVVVDRLVPVYDQDGRLIAFILIRESSTADRAETIA